MVEEEACRVSAHEKWVLMEVVPEGLGEDFYIPLGSGLENPVNLLLTGNS